MALTRCLCNLQAQVLADHQCMIQRSCSMLKERFSVTITAVFSLSGTASRNPSDFFSGKSYRTCLNEDSIVECEAETDVLAWGRNLHDDKLPS